MSGNSTERTSAIIDGRTVPDLLDEQMIHAVVHGFYAAIREDDLVGPVFARAIAPDDWPHHLGKMCDFWSSTLLRSGRYEGRPLPPHLAIPELGDEHFKRWLGLFRETVNRLCPPEIARLFLDRAMRVAQSFRLAVAFSRGQDTLLVKPITEQDIPALPGAARASAG